MEKENSERCDPKPILHVLVVGFHHKKGCQVEYSYPPLVEGSNDCTECPLGWKYLPTLALPDGSHNYDKDTVFFNLPSLTDRDQTVFGISCFRQIPAEKLKNRTDDITRSTVQKSVCVLSRVPLYGHIQVKMELITHAYFDEGDFTKVSLLEDTYHNLNDCIEQIEDLPNASQLYVGLSARELILRMRHKALLLYKLLLLEKRVLFFHSPVEPLCSTILTLLSLHPGLLIPGLQQSACFRPSRPMSPVPEFSILGDKTENHLPNGDAKVERGEECPHSEPTDINKQSPESIINNQNDHIKRSEKNGDESWNEETRWQDRPSTISRDTSSADLVNECPLPNSMTELSLIDPSTCGTPLPIFTQSYLCLPYLSLPYMDMLTDENVRGYVVGATNVLFKQKKNLADILVEVETCRIETCDIELKRALHLSTEDLRFADYLVRHVGNRSQDTFLDGVGYEGGDDWIRSQFHAYTLALLRTSLLSEGSKECDQFNKWFMASWQGTHSFSEWAANASKTQIMEVSPGHPFSGQLSVTDMKLRLAHTMQTTEGGRKLNQAMVSTSRAMATTGRAVGGALSQAKGALSSWWSNLTLPPTQSENPVEEAMEAVEPQSNPVLEV